MEQIIKELKLLSPDDIDAFARAGYPLHAEAYRQLAEAYEKLRQRVDSHDSCHNVACSGSRDHPRYAKGVTCSCRSIERSSSEQHLERRVALVRIAQLLSHAGVSSPRTQEAYRIASSSTGHVDTHFTIINEEQIEALRKYVEWHGAIHAKACPSDDTCNCIGKSVNDLVNSIFRDSFDQAVHRG